MGDTMTFELDTKFANVAGTSLNVPRIGLGTWAIGGWMWGGTDEEESVKTIHAAVERGINLIDTAPAYGFGRSEEILGRAIAEGGLLTRCRRHLRRCRRCSTKGRFELLASVISRFRKSSAFAASPKL